MTLTYRPRARSAVAALGALVWGFFFFGLIDLLVRFVPGEEFYDTYLLETGWGVLYFILVTVPLLSVTFVPAITSPVTQVALAGCAVAVAAVLTTTWSQLWPAGGLLMVAALLFVLGERSTDRPSVAEPHPTSLATRVDIPTLLLTVAAAVPLIWFAAEMVASARAGRYPNDDITVGLNHWPMQAALPLAMLADAGLTAVRQSGCRYRHGRSWPGRRGWACSRSPIRTTPGASDCRAVRGRSCGRPSSRPPHGDRRARRTLPRSERQLSDPVRRRGAGRVPGDVRTVEVGVVHC